MAFRMGARGLSTMLASVALLASGAGAEPRLKVCVDYGCDKTSAARLDAAASTRIAGLFSRIDSAEAERTAVARAIGELERIVGRQTGTGTDAPRNTGLEDRNGQLDCIAESHNTLTYLQFLDDHGHLDYHSISGRVVRRRNLFGTHWTAVLEEYGSGQRYAVDSWYGANGDPAEIQPLAAWLQGARPVDDAD